ncbi:MAG: MFS transporter [Trueperaceae bacterium]
MNAIDYIRTSAQRPFFGWWIVGGAIGIQILVAGLVMQAYGTYVAIWQLEFGWSATVFATGFAMQRAVMGLLSPFQGWVLQRIGSRRVIQVGLVVLALGFVALSRFETQAGFFGAMVLMALGVGLSGFLSLTTTIVNWFERRRSSALALMQVGISIGGLAVPIVAWALTTYGWRPTLLVAAGLVLAVGLPLSALMRSTPEAYGMHPDGDDPDEVRTLHENEGGPARHDFHASEALRTRAFWLIAAGHAIAVSVVASVTVHMVVHLNEGLGFSIQAAATMVAVMTGATMGGQLIGGVLGDRFEKRLIAAAAMLAHAVALLAVAFAPGLGWVLFFAIVHGLAWGVRGPIMQALRADYFGRTSFATIMGISFTFVMLGQMAGPLFAGALADLLGDFRAAFAFLAALVGAGSLCFYFAVPPSRDGTVPFPSEIGSDADRATSG